jgi:hypothetical protein
MISNFNKIYPEKMHLVQNSRQYPIFYLQTINTFQQLYFMVILIKSYVMPCYVAGKIAVLIRVPLFSKTGLTA